MPNDAAPDFASRLDELSMALSTRDRWEAVSSTFGEPRADTRGWFGRKGQRLEVNALGGLGHVVLPVGSPSVGLDVQSSLARVVVTARKEQVDMEQPLVSASKRPNGRGRGRGSETHTPLDLSVPLASSTVCEKSDRSLLEPSARCEGARQRDGREDQ